MDRIKSIALTTLGIIVALASLGLLASVGLAVIGALFILGVCGALVAGIASIFAERDNETHAIA